MQMDSSYHLRSIRAKAARRVRIKADLSKMGDAATAAREAVQSMIDTIRDLEVDADTKKKLTTLTNKISELGSQIGDLGWEVNDIVNGKDK